MIKKNLYSDIKISFLLLKRDLDYYLEDKTKFIIFIIVYLSGLLIFLTSLNNMIGYQESFFNFLLIGYSVVAYLNISSSSGFEIMKEKNLGKWDYDRLFPVTRWNYALLRIIGISLRGYLNFLFCLILIIPLLLNIFSFYHLILFLLLNFALSIIFTSSAIIPLLVLRDNITFQTFAGISIRTYFLLGSTIFYPYNAIPNYIQPIVLINPITWVLELIRSGMNISGAESFPITDTVLFLLIIFLFSIAGAIIALVKLK